MGTTLWISLEQQKMTKTGRQFLPTCLLFRHCGEGIHTTKSMVVKTLAEGYVGRVNAPNEIPTNLTSHVRFFHQTG